MRKKQTLVHCLLAFYVISPLQLCFGMSDSNSRGRTYGYGTSPTSRSEGLTELKFDRIIGYYGGSAPSDTWIVLICALVTTSSGKSPSWLVHKYSKQIRILDERRDDEIHFSN